jgi:hypothetical protein
MACVALLNDDVSAVYCQGFVGSGTSKDSVNFCVTQFNRRCMGTTCSELAGILVGSLQFNVARFFTYFSGLRGMIFSQLNNWCDGNTEEVGEF